MRIWRLAVVVLMALELALAVGGCGDDDDDGEAAVELTPTVPGDDVAAPTPTQTEATPASEPTPTADAAVEPTPTTPPAADVPTPVPDGTTSSSAEGGFPVSVDSVAITGVWPVVHVSDDGRASVVYMRELSPDPQYEIRWSRCDDPACSSMTHLTVSDGEYSLWAAGSGAETADGMLISGTQTRGPNQIVFWQCDDTGCSGPTRRGPGYVLGMTIGVDGLPVIGYSVFVQGQGDTLYFGLCQDTACQNHRAISISDGAVWTGTGTVQLLPDGSPVMIYPAGIDNDTGEFRVAACSDPECSEVTVLKESPDWATNTPSGDPTLPFFVHNRGSNVHLLACTDADCSGMSDTVIHTIEDVGEVLESTGVYVQETLVVLTRYRPDTQARPPVSELVILGCNGDSCQTVGEPSSPTFYMSVAALSDTQAVAAIHSGVPVLCDYVEPDACVDPEDDLSSLSLNLIDVPTP